MNNRRLSTYTSDETFPVVDRARLDVDIDRLLSGPSNYDNREGGI